MTQYMSIKRNLKDIADMAKSQFPNDKPAIRQIINDSVYFQCKEYQLNERERDMLSNYACKLHPKD